MNKRVWSIAFFCLAAGCVQGEENVPAKTRDQDLKVVLKKTYFHAQAEPFLNMVAMEAASSSEKSLDSEEVVQKFREAFDDPAVQAKFHDAYSVFTDEEVKEIRRIHESPVFEKYGQHGAQAFQKNMAAMIDVFKEIIDKNGAVKEKEELASDAGIVEITQSNFQKEIEESTIPVVIDVYSSNCPPCRMMEPILEQMSREYKDAVRFVRINSDKELELARKYEVTQLPTLLFVKPGEAEASLRTTGFTSKKDLQAKMVEFLKTDDAEIENIR